MHYKDKLIKDGYMRRIHSKDLPPGSWQREWAAAGNSFYEFDPSPAKIMGKIARSEAQAAELQESTILEQAQAVGQVAVSEPALTKLALVA